MQVCATLTAFHSLKLKYVWHFFLIGRPLYAELSPVTDFREACCRQNENGECNRGGFCNFMHLRLPSKDLLRQLRHGQAIERRLNPKQNASAGAGWEPPKREAGRGRSASPSRRGGRDGEDRWSRKGDGEDRWSRKTDGEDRWTRKA
jgi:splicing factor U2AF 35 kDa subunit